MSDFIYHYTDIDTLALILENKTIRFNRLDRVDDISEGDSFKQLKLQKFIFVSCWTYDENESIPNWHMYTNEMSGVRLKFKRKLFDWKPINFPKNHNQFLEGEIKSPIPFDQIFNDKYFILPPHKDNFENIVTYDENFKKIKNEAISLKKEGDTVHININKPNRIASIKDPVWKFQKESRFVLFIFPSFPNNGLVDKNWTDKIPSYFIQALQNGKGPEIDYFDVQINDDAINKLEVTVGPLCPPGKKLIVKTLIEKYCKDGKVIDSSLTGTIRSPKR